MPLEALDIPVTENPFVADDDTARYPGLEPLDDGVEPGLNVTAASNEIYDLSEQAGISLDEAESLHSQLSKPAQKPPSRNDAISAKYADQLKNDHISRLMQLSQQPDMGDNEYELRVEAAVEAVTERAEILMRAMPSLSGQDAWEMVLKANGGPENSGKALYDAFHVDRITSDNYMRYAASNITQQNHERLSKGLEPLDADTQVAITDAYRQMVGIAPMSGAFTFDYQGRAVPVNKFAEARRKYNEAHAFHNWAANAGQTLAGTGLGVWGLVDPEGAAKQQKKLSEIYAPGGGVSGFLGRATGSTLTSLPSIFGGPATSTIWLLGQSGSAGGQTRIEIAEMRKQGADISGLQEAGAVVAVGALEFLFEKIDVGAAKSGANIIKTSFKDIGKELAENGIESASKLAVKKLSPLLKEYAIGTASEVATQITQNLSNHLIWNPEQGVFEGSLEAAGQGLIGQILGGGIAGFSQIGTTQAAPPASQTGEPTITPAARQAAQQAGITDAADLKAFVAARQKYGFSELSGLGKGEIQKEETDFLFEQADKSGQSTGVITIDMANFKAVNDNLSHADGDRALAAIGRAITESVRGERGDMSGYHPGGDEFTIVLQNVNAEQGEIIRQRIQENINKALQAEGLDKVTGQQGEYPVFAAAGLHIREAKGDTFEAAYKKAEEVSNQIKAKMKQERGGQYARQETAPVPTEQTSDIAPPPTPKLLTPEQESKAKERMLITRTNEILPKAFNSDGTYLPRSTDELAIKARNLIADNLETAEKYAVEGRDDNSIALTMELIKHYGEQADNATQQDQKDFWYDKMAKLANEKARLLTEAGRMVQAASILGRMTPEGQIRFAAREIQRYNEQVDKERGGVFGLKKKLPELSREQAEYIRTEMREIETMPNTREKQLRFHQLQQYINNLVPTSLYRKIVTAWKAGLLTGVRTTGLNIMSNTTHGFMEVAKDIPATVVDKVVSMFTKQRAVTTTLGGVTGGTKEGVYEAWQYMKTGFDPRHDIGGKLDIKKYSFGKGKLNKAMQWGTERVFRFLGAQDQVFYYASKARSMYEQAKVAAINEGLKGKAMQSRIDALMQAPTENMVRAATNDAESAVFMNMTKLGEVAQKLSRLPGGELVIPFARTPSAVAMQIVNYSPVGAVKTIVENIGKGRFDQRAFSKGLGRSTVGTGILYVGSKLAEAGLMNLGWPEDERERELWKAEGRQPYSIKVGDEWKSAKVLGPAANLLFIGGTFQQSFMQSGSPSEAMWQATTGTMDQFTQQTFLEDTGRFSDALRDPERYGVQFVGGKLSSIVPRFVGDIAEFSDEVQRRTEGVTGQLQARIPGARQQLEPELTVTGEERPAGNPYSLFRPSQAVRKPVVDELRRLWDQGWEVSPAKLGPRREGYESLTPEENTALWRRAGTLINDGLSELVKANGYEQATDEDKAAEIERIIQDAQDAAKAEAAAKKLNAVKGDEQVQLVFKMKSDGLLTEAMLPGLKLSKRKARPGLQK